MSMHQSADGEAARRPWAGELPEIRDTAVPRPGVFTQALADARTQMSRDGVG